MIRSAIAILFLALATPALAESPAGDESYAAGRAIVADIHRIVTPNGIQESFVARSEEHTSELQSLMRISYAVLCLKNKRPESQIQTKTDGCKSTDKRKLI